ncbi:MAG TPA: response regulator [Coriobacteriia bacterium]
MGWRVLVVEDDAQNAYLVTFILERRGYEVRVVPDGDEALGALEDFTPDLVLMDMLLPRMGGQETARRMKARPGMDGVPVVALTAYSMKGDRERILETGCDGYMSKPIDPDTFVEELERFLVAGDDRDCSDG